MLFLAFTTSCFYSCYDDKGNYDYQEINEISVTGIDTLYIKDVGESLTIVPKLEFSMEDKADQDNYKYSWFTVSSSNPNITQILDSTRNLENYKLTMRPGAYDLYYRITDKNGTITQVKTKLTTTTIIYEGYLVMNDDQGVMRLDMLSYRNGKFEFFKDILTEVGSELPTQQGPISVATFPDRNAPGEYAIWLLTQAGANCIHSETFKFEPKYNIKYYVQGSLPDGFKADAMSNGLNSQAMMCSDGNLYAYSRSTQNYWGIRTNTLDGVNYLKISPKMGISSSMVVVFDETTKSFYQTATNKTSCGQMPPGDKFSYENTKKDLLHIQYNYPNFFAILKDIATNKRHVLRFTDKGVQELYQEMQGPDISKAELFTVSTEFMTYVFYSVGGKVYQYDTGLNTSKLMLDFGSDKVTYLNFLELGIYDEPYTSWSKRLIVGTYNEASKQGKMDFYTVPSVNGDLVKSSSYDGFAKIVSVAYRER